MFIGRLNLLGRAMGGPLAADTGLADDEFRPNTVLYDGGQVFAPRLNGRIFPNRADYDGGQVFAPRLNGRILPDLVTYDGGQIFAPALAGPAAARPSLITGGVFTDAQTGVGTSQTTLTVAPLAGSDRLAIIFSAHESGADVDVSSVVWSGVTADLIDSVELNSGGIRKIFAHVVREANYPTVSGTITTTYTGNVNNDGLIGMVQIQDAAQAVSFGLVSSNTASSDTTMSLGPIDAADDTVTITFGLGDNTLSISALNATDIGNFGIANDLSGVITLDDTDSTSEITSTYTIDSADQILGIGFSVNPV